MLRLVSHRLILAFLVALAAVAHLAAPAGAAPQAFPGGAPSLAAGDLAAPALTSTSPQAEACGRPHQPKRFSDAEPSGAAIPPACALPWRSDRYARGSAPAVAAPCRAGILSPGQRAPPASLPAT